MPDMMLIQGAITGLQTAANIAKGMMQLKTTADMQVQVIELQSAILAAQSSALAAQSDQFSMVEQIRQLKKEIADIKAWEETKQRYALTSPWTGCFVYAMKESCKGSKPPHWICEHCYQDRREAILQKMPHPERRHFRVIGHRSPLPFRARLACTHPTLRPPVPVSAAHRLAWYSGCYDSRHPY